EAFKKPFLNAQLVICGDGDTKTRLYEIIKTRTHIHYLGNLTNKEAVALQQRATILVNPRSNEEDFTKYSFPYKTVEYLKSGRPVVMARLSGIPIIYENYINYLDSTKPEDIKLKLEQLLSLTKEELDKKGAKGRAFILENKTPEKALKNVCAMIEKL
ncbi:MAG TPA: glycosyltransferase, partial [Acholeplasma sp.]|nr:glycosyltransferase [Acholeplasma sp.]